MIRIQINRKCILKIHEKLSLKKYTIKRIKRN